MGGGAIVYLTSRISPYKLILPCLVWSLLSSVFFLGIFLFIDIVPEEFIIDVVILGFLQSLFVFQQQVALGRNLVKKFNFLVIGQWLVTAISLAVFYFIFDKLESTSYVISMYISFGFTLILGLIITWKEWKNMPFSFSIEAIRQIWNYGFFAFEQQYLSIAGLSNVIHLSRANGLSKWGRDILRWNADQ